MSLKIGNVLKAIDEGKWVKVPARAGDFHFKVKQLLPGEQFTFNKKRKGLDADDPKNTALMYETIASHVLDWKGLQQADGSEIAFDPELFKDKTFMDSLMMLTTVDGKYLMLWIVSIINKSDVFAEDDSPDFLASI